MKKLQIGDFDRNEKSTKKPSEDMTRNIQQWATETKSFESSVKFDISEIQNDLFQKWVKNYPLKPLNEFLIHALSTDVLWFTSMKKRKILSWRIL
jgi:hypothetical protein